MHPVLRRTFLARSAAGIGGVALSSLLGGLQASAAGGKTWPGVLEPLHHAPVAKRVIWLTMAGGPSHLETFDYKPVLAAQDGQPMPESFTKGQQIAQLQGAKLVCFGPQLEFKKFGECGAEICGLFEQMGTVVDEMCIIRSMTTDAINHDPAHMFMNTGSQIAGRPSMGAWVTYGLGAETEDLPAFVVLTSLGQGGQNQPIAARQWSSGFLPSRQQGVHLRGKGDPVLYLSNPPGVDRNRQQDVVEAVKQLNGDYDAIAHDRNRHADRAVRDGVLDAGQRAGADGRRRRPTSLEPTAASRATVRSPPTACWPGGWRSAGCGSSSFITRTGIITAA
jgi:hypothetical protein